jgi:hypothetical protein
MLALRLTLTGRDWLVGFAGVGAFIVFIEVRQNGCNASFASIYTNAIEAQWFITFTLIFQLALMKRSKPNNL